MAQIQFRSDDTTKWGQGYGNGSAGVGSINTSTDAPTKTTFTGSSGAFTGTFGSTNGFSNGDIVLIHQSQGTGVGIWQLNYIVNISTSTFLYPLVTTFGTGCQIQKIPQYSNLTINSGQTLTASSWGGSTGGIYAVMANGSAIVTGTISIAGNKGADQGAGAAGGSGVGFSGGKGGQNTTQAFQGEGSVGVGSGSTSANGNAGGGGLNTGGAPGEAQGGSGGNGTAGTTGALLGGGTVGAAGAASGSADLTTMTFGGSGGGTAEHNGSGGLTNGAGGGAGAGILLVIAPTITITGGINGNGGDGGIASGAEAGGGGAGGSILLKGQNVTLGTNLITATGGVGGSQPVTGGVGRIHVDYSGTLSGSTNPGVDSRKDQTLANAFLGGIL